MFFVLSRELISIVNSWKAPKLGTIVHQYLVSKTVIGNFEIRAPSHFITAFSTKKCSILQTWKVKSHILKMKQKFKSLTPFCRSRLLRVSTIRTCLWCSLIAIEINSSIDTIFLTHFGFFWISLGAALLPVFLISFNLHIKQLSNKTKRIKIRPQTTKITPWPYSHPFN